jgi:hypothetical protein
VEHSLTVIEFQMLVEADANGGLGQGRCEGRLADHQWIAPQVVRNLLAACKCPRDLWRAQRRKALGSSVTAPGLTGAKWRRAAGTLPTTMVSLRSMHRGRGNLGASSRRPCNAALAALRVFVGNPTQKPIRPLTASARCGASVTPRRAVLRQVSAALHSAPRRRAFRRAADAGG